MAENSMAALLRTPDGKGAARQIRRQGRIPGVFYFGKDINFSFSVDQVELVRVLKGHSTLIQLDIPGEDSRECIIRNIQRDPVSEKFVHVDLMGVKRGQKLHVTVPIKFSGVPVGVKTDGGILQHNRTDMEIECLPKDIPNFIEIDVSALKIGNSVSVESLNVEGIRFLDDPKTILASVIAPTTEKAEAQVATAEEGAEAAKDAGKFDEDSK